MVMPAPIYIFSGPETFLKEDAFDKLKSHLKQDKIQDIDCNIFHAGEISIRDVFDIAKTSPFISKKRLILLKDGERLSTKDQELFLSYASTPCRSTCFILDTDEILSEKDLIFSAVKDTQVKVAYFKRPTRFELQRWISRRFSEKFDKRISQEAIEQIVESVGTSLRELDNAIEKVALFSEHKTDIEAIDVLEILDSNALHSMFDMINAMSDRDPAKALRILAGNLRIGKKANEIVGLLGWQLRQFLKAKEMIESGVRKEEIGKKLKVSKFFLDRFIDRVKNLNNDQIKNRLNLLLQADIDLKSSMKDEKIILEMLIINGQIFV